MDIDAGPHRTWKYGKSGLKGRSQVADLYEWASVSESRAKAGSIDPPPLERVFGG
jgi:hypothetical protein